MQLGKLGWDIYFKFQEDNMECWVTSILVNADNEIQIYFMQIKHVINVFGILELYQ